MTDYYSEKLSANKLKRCYDLVKPRIAQYLAAEINFVSVVSSVVVFAATYTTAPVNIPARAVVSNATLAKLFFGTQPGNGTYTMGTQELGKQLVAFTIVVIRQHHRHQIDFRS